MKKAKKPRKMTKEHKLRIAAAQKERWAKKKEEMELESAPPVPGDVYSGEPMESRTVLVFDGNSASKTIVPNVNKSMSGIVSSGIHKSHIEEPIIDRHVALRNVFAKD